MLVAENTSKEIEELKTVILEGDQRKNSENNESDKIIQYIDMSRAIPNGPHSNSFDAHAIDRCAETMVF